MKIWFAPYVLRARAPLGSRARSAERHGALLRVESTDGGSGYSDLHPWPELGDPDLERQLSALRDGRLTAQVERSLALAADDAGARRAGRSLFDGLVVPPSHLLVPSLADLDVGAVEEGFTHLKAKIGREPEREPDAVARIDAALGARMLWRLDANASLSFEGIDEWLGCLRARVGEERFHAMIDFVEDPCPYDSAKWRRLRAEHGLGVALDRENGGAADPRSYTHRVLKPAVQDPDALAGHAVAAGHRVVVTSYLDHPVGQMHAARCAAALAARHPESLDIAGLLSHGAYEPTAYSEAIFTDGCRLVSPSGPGIGFDDLLESEPWRKLAEAPG